jgi:hypothetical protein
MLITEVSCGTKYSYIFLLLHKQGRSAPKIKINAMATGAKALSKKAKAG